MADGAGDQFQQVVGAIESLQSAYSLERKVFLGGIVLNILLLALFSVLTAFRIIAKEDWMFVFGPPGLFAGACTAAMTYFNKSLNIVDRMAGGKGGDGR